MRIEVDNLHHATLLLGQQKEAELYLKALCDALGIKLANNPDLFYFRMNTFGIDNARELKLLSARKAIAGKKIFFISSLRLTLEAQNALLKTFEDPYPSNHFFIVAREEAAIEPTCTGELL